MRGQVFLRSLHLFDHLPQQSLRCSLQRLHRLFSVMVLGPFLLNPLQQSFPKGCPRPSSFSPAFGFERLQEVCIHLGRFGYKRVPEPRILLLNLLGKLGEFALGIP